MTNARRTTLGGFALGGLLAAKMIAFEPVRPEAFGIRVEVVAVLLPLALPLGWRGIGALGLGCGLAHTIHGMGPLEGLGTGLAVLVALAAVHLGIRGPWDPASVLARCLALAVLAAISLGSAFAVVRGDPFLVAAAGTFASVFAPIALAGPAALLAALRIARFRPGSSRGVAA